MTDLGLRDLGSFGPGGRGTGPVFPSLPPSHPGLPAASKLDLPPVIITPPPAAPNRAVFAGDVPAGPDALGLDPMLALLAETVVHRATAMPLVVGLSGGPGAGKSFALARLGARIRDLSAAAAAATPGPFLANVHIEQIDAGVLEGEPALALAAHLHAGLRQPYPALAREIGHAARDPQAILRETSEKLDEARRRLDAERRTLEESGSRLARLSETVLYESAGSQIDSYARANRARIEGRLNAFGIKGDPVRNFKDLVGSAAESGGVLGLLPRAVFEFKGQMRLIVWAIVLTLLGVGLDIAIETKDTWLASLRTGPQFAIPAEVWLTDHIGLLGLARKTVFLLAAILIAINLLRAARFIRPVFAGIRLLRADLENRRRDLGGLYAHQTKRADLLAGDVEKLSRAAAEAERRAGGEGAHGALLDTTPFETSAAAQAQSFFANLGALPREERFQAKGAAPGRIVLVLDHLDSVPPERARAILGAVHRAAAVSGLAVLTGFDPGHAGIARADVERWIQVPVSLDARAGAMDYAALVARLLGQQAQISGAHLPGRTPSPPGQTAIDPARSKLDTVLSEREGALLAALAPVAGASPRAVKRLINLYTLARALGDGPRGLLALFLAVDIGGTWAERQAAAALEASVPFEGETGPRMAQAIAAVKEFEGHSTPPQAAQAAAQAKLFSMPL